jgi:ABC-type transport system involved in multi-copper enzyme maturation permease subunit
VTRAEFLKIWASRVPLVFLLAIPVGCYLIVFELYHVEHAGELMPIRHALQAVPLLFLGVWRMLLFQGAVIAFAAFWTTIDSQYGMARVVGALPLSRVACLLGKWLGIGGHLVLATIALIASLVGWGVIYSGVQGITSVDVGRLGRFSVELLVVTLALGGVAAAAASFRRTVASGIVTAFIALIGLGFLSMVSSDVVAPRFVFVRYLFYPLQEFPDPWPGRDSPFLRLYSVSDFYRIMLVTPLLFAIPAILYFRQRDISE